MGSPNLLASYKGLSLISVQHLCDGQRCRGHVQGGRALKREPRALLDRDKAELWILRAQTIMAAAVAEGSCLGWTGPRSGRSGWRCKLKSCVPGR